MIRAGKDPVKDFSQKLGHVGFENEFGCGVLWEQGLCRGGETVDTVVCKTIIRPDVWVRIPSAA